MTKNSSRPRPDEAFSTRHATPPAEHCAPHPVLKRKQNKEAILHTTWQSAGAAIIAVVAGASGAYAVTPAPHGTVNAYTAEELTRARKAVSEADYHPAALAFAQDGNIFLTARRNRELYEVTVTPSEKVYASTGLPQKPAPGN
jgi:membrane-bound lytic murein transglycosylase